MIRKTGLGFKLERTEEELTAHGGLALIAEHNHLMEPKPFVTANGQVLQSYILPIVRFRHVPSTSH